MVSLTAQQRRVLDQLLHGATGLSRSKQLPKLKQLGYVDDRGHPTLEAWHEFDEFRYLPRIQIPQDWEIETWRHEMLMVVEGPENPRFDPHGPNSWSNAKDFTFILSVYQIMQFYRECLVEEQKFINETWSETLDELSDRTRKSRVRNNIYANTKTIESRRSSIRDTAQRWGCSNISLSLYNWGEKLYRYHTIVDDGLHSILSFRYSLQRNFDEIHRFLVQPGYNPQQMMFFARITID